MAIDRKEGFRAICSQTHYSDVSKVLPVDERGGPLLEGAPTYEEAQGLGDQMLENGNWLEYRIERHYYKQVT